MAVENMAAANGEASAVAAERCSEGHGEDGRVDVCSKSEVSLSCCALQLLVASASEECSGNLPSPESLFPSLGHGFNESQGRYDDAPEGECQ